MAEKSSLFTNAPSGDDVAWGLEGADNAILAASVGGAVAAGVATKVMPKGMKRRLQRKKSWVNRKSKRCKDKCPCWLLNEGSFGEAGFEIDHELPWSKGYTHTGQLRAVCHLCHGLLSRLQR